MGSHDVKRLIAVLVASLAVACAALSFSASSAHAFSTWAHDGATQCSDCHSGSTPTDTNCQSCHTGYQVAAGQNCWQCHEPGADQSAGQTAAGCSATCHLWDPLLKLYITPFTHGTSPHLGASGYGKTCTDCHPVSQSIANPGGDPHHSGVTLKAPTCATCHNGKYAVAQVSHAGVSCQSCHSGMNIPATPAVCLKCHTNIGYSKANPLSCTNPACHGTAIIHNAKPKVDTKCTDCHKAHYTNLGTCITCHPNVNGYHHGTVKAVPLASCTVCHNGKIAVRMQNHDSVKPACTACHGVSMNIPTTSTCLRCHSSAAKHAGGYSCLLCHLSAVHNTHPYPGGLNGGL